MKFREILKLQKTQPKIDPQQFQFMLKAFELNPRILYDELEHTLQYFIYEKMTPLSKQDITKITTIFRKT